MNKRLKNVTDVVSWRLCLGCGACVCVCPRHALTLTDIEHDGLRPRADAGACERCGACLKVCPGVGIERDDREDAAINSLREGWGTVLEVWEGYANDPAIRFEGSSGGVATALSLFCLEKRGMPGVLHIGPAPRNPLANATVVSYNRTELLMRTGSRYAPAAPCMGLTALEPKKAPYVFVGKPCDVVAVRKWQALDRDLGDRIGIAISIFCAGTPSTLATRKILERLSVGPEEVAEFRYRGRGWPGRTVATTNNEEQRERSMSYDESWGSILSKHTQFRCRLCPDATGELADVSCGDPWYRQIEPEDPGRSLVLARTALGRETLHEAMAAGYVQLEQVGPDTLPRSQRSLLQKRQHLWGRLLAMRLSGAPVPRFKGFSLWANWRALPLAAKARSIGGTIYRIRTRGWNRPRQDHLT